MSQNNNFHYARNLMENHNANEKRSGTMHAIGNHVEGSKMPAYDLNPFNSPKSFDGHHPGGEMIPDIEKDLYLESLSNGDLSRVDATSMQRSFTHLQHVPPRSISKSTIAMRENIIRKTTSESGFP